jgi:hypothetical protein
MKTLLATIVLSVMAVAQQPCPSGYHHEGDSSACWPDVSRQESHPGPQPDAQSPSVPAQPTTAQPSQVTSLVIFREGHFAGSGLKPSIYVDGKEVARLKNGSYFSMQIEPGKHDLSSSAKHESPLLVEIKPGETSYVQMIVVQGTWRGAGRLIPVPPDDGKIAVSKLKILSD